MKNVEILAPVGSKEMLNVAISSGADAVYLGLENFNARAKADNFNSENIRETIMRCHLFGVRVYITVNTLISDDEINDVLSMVEKAHFANADAFIVQDLGLATLMKQKFPNIVLHASTQMGICNVEGAKVLDKLGFSRVVVARETTLEDIRLIKHQTNLEIESFVQGALCVCYSGSCYLSSILKNKSGNRGECLQLCRLPYKLIESGKIKKQGYLLSTRDISFIDRLEELVDAGVCSLKIEGRLRRPAYLAQAVKSVRNALDKKNIKDEDFALKKVFSRGGFNKGIYLNTKTDGGIINSNVNNHLGVKIGKVLSIEPFKDIFKVQISSTHSLSVGDGLKFMSKRNQTSLGVGSFKCLGKNNYVIFSKTCPDKNCDVYLTVDSKNEEKLISGERKLQINGKITAFAGQNLTVNLTCGNTSVEYIGATLEKAQKQPVSNDEIKNAFSKLGETEFCLSNLIVESDGIFIAKSQLNLARRESIGLLYNKIIDNYENKNIKPFKKTIQKNTQNNHKKCKTNYFIVDCKESLNKINTKGVGIIYAPSIYSVADVESFVNFSQNMIDGKIYLYLPVVANYRDLKLINQILDQLSPSMISVAAGSLYGINFASKGFEVITLSNNNVANKFSRDVLFEHGVVDCVGSIEQNLFGHIEGTLEYVGNPALMTIVMCPFIEHLGSSCSKCVYSKNAQLLMDDGTKLKIRRNKIADCYFELYEDKKITIPQGNGYVIDLRG